jgi:hypothetical protein
VEWLKKVERGHQKDGVNRQSPMRLQHHRGARVFRSLRSRPARRFLNASHHIDGEQCRHRAEHEQAAPPDEREKKSVNQRGAEIPCRISGLQQTRDDASRRGRDSFHRERCADTPDAAHRNAKQRADTDQEDEVRRKGRQKLENGIEHDHDDKGWPPAVPIRNATEYEGPDRPRRQRHNDGEGDARYRRAKICGHFVQHKTIRKKSKASNTQARKLAITAPRCAGVQEPAAPAARVADRATAGSV